MRLSKAVILAAGKGKRLGHLTMGVPKGFISLGEKTIIEESIEKMPSFLNPKTLMGNKWEL